jgi:DNA gyrase inhibitor GyrI
MMDLDVRIERLRPLRVAWVRAVGCSPEQEAWALLNAWARPAGLLDDPVANPVFGFNNPSPTPAVEEYGYEFWVPVGPDCHLPTGIGQKEFAGGVYAVTSCRVGPEMPGRWRALIRWVRESQHTWLRSAHELERVQNPMASPDEFIVDLCLPLDETAGSTDSADH